MFTNFNSNFAMSTQTLKTLETVMNPEAYTCPTISSIVKTYLKKDSKNLLLIWFAKNWWAENSNIFLESLKIGYDKKTKKWEFSALHKLSGSFISNKNSKYVGSFKKISPAAINLQLIIKINSDGKNVALEASLEDISCLQKQLVLIPCEIEPEYGDFKFETTSTMLLVNQGKMEKIQSKLADNLVLLQYAITTYEATQGDFLESQHFSKKSNPSLNECKIIAKSYNMAVKKFPIFAKADRELQSKVMQEALVLAKKEARTEGKAIITEYLFSKYFYFEITAHQLDQKLLIGRYVRDLSMQKWGREHFKGGPSKLLTKKEDFDSFDYSKVRPDNLVWVTYDGINIPAYQLFNICISNENISDFYTSFVIKDVNEEYDAIV